MRLFQLLRLLWAAPWSLVGMLLGGLMLACRGRGRVRVRVVQGALEFSGGALAALPWPMDAITLGHVILGRSDALLDGLRCHEQVHVRQYERWGILLVPAYLASSAWHGLIGGDAYRDNAFERQARALSASPQLVHPRVSSAPADLKR